MFYKELQPWEKPQLYKCKTTIIFLRAFNIANQLLTRHLPFTPLSQVDEWMANQVETLGLWIVTSSVTFIKSANQSSIKLCLILNPISFDKFSCLKGL